MKPAPGLDNAVYKTLFYCEAYDELAKNFYYIQIDIAILLQFVPKSLSN